MAPKTVVAGITLSEPIREKVETLLAEAAVRLRDVPSGTAAIMMENGVLHQGSPEAMAKQLEIAGYLRQAKLMRESVNPCAIVIATLLQDGTAVTSLLTDLGENDPS